MPRSRKPAAAAAAMPGGVFSPVAHRLAGLQGPIYPLHVGDTWLEPFPGARMQVVDRVNRKVGPASPGGYLH